MGKKRNLKVLKIFNENFGVKIFVTFTVTIFLISICFTVFFFHYQKKTMEEEMIETGTILSSVLAFNSKLGVFSENVGLLTDPVDGIFQQKEVADVKIFNQEGKVLIDHERKGRLIKNNLITGEEKLTSNMLKLLSTSSFKFYMEDKNKIEFWANVYSGSSSPNEEALFFQDDILQKKDQIIGFVSILIEKKILHKRLAALFLKSILIGFVFLCAGSLIIYFILKSITKPLKRLTEGVNMLGSKGTAEQIPVETKDEIGKLADAFNNMYESLKKRNAEKRQLEEQLRHSEKMEAIGTLAGGIAHDFNNILGVIVGYTELAMLDMDQTDSIYPNLKQVLKAGERAADLVNQILVFSRKDKQERKPLQISVIAKEVLKMIRSSLPTTIEIRQDIKPGLSPVLSDPTQIHRVLMNLCTNAAYAMNDRAGILKVSLEDVNIDSITAAGHLDLLPGRYQKLSVSDTGAGIDPRIINRIFDPFFTTKGPGKGTGMGLAVIHGIVKGHKGSITVRSKPGKGTTFDIYIPTINSGHTDETKPLDTIPVGCENILFIDDEDALVAIGEKMLGHLGYTVTGVANSSYALEVFKKEPEKYQLVITDMTMPKMTGLDLAIKIISIRPEIPIILCTGFSEMISDEKIKSAGIQRLIMKPYSKTEMARIVREVLDKQKS